jgi:predicted dithiol-disulfide oxidoreductase (DUF899 family)
VASRAQAAAGKEKELTRRRDALSVERRKSPMVEIEKSTSSRDRMAGRLSSTCSTAAAS